MFISHYRTDSHLMVHAQPLFCRGANDTMNYGDAFNHAVVNGVDVQLLEDNEIFPKLAIKLGCHFAVVASPTSYANIRNKISEVTSSYRKTGHSKGINRSARHYLDTHGMAGCFCNHSKDPNATISWTSATAVDAQLCALVPTIVALRRIEAGEFVMLDYGIHYDMEL